MKRNILTIALLFMGMISFAQFDKIVVEEVDHNGTVPGTTYRVYVQLQNEGDGVDMVFGAPGIPLKIESTKPFYQHSDGGLTSKECTSSQIVLDPRLEFDSFVTIGRTTDQDNDIALFKVDGKNNIDPTEFEGGGTLETEDGAWYCIPLKPQTVSGPDKKVLIMQLTTKGKVTGVMNLLGKINADGNPSWREDQVTFTCGE